MSDDASDRETETSQGTPRSDAQLCVGVVVHPERDIDRELSVLRAWAGDRECGLIQVDDGEREVAERGGAEDCDLVVTIGGDGTALTGIREASRADRPVLAVACGSLGALTASTADGLPDALDRFAAGEWQAREVPALELLVDDEIRQTALNDLAVLRAGEGQVTVEAHVDGVLYGRFVGDGLLVSTPLGSSAYTLAAGGPLLAPGAKAFVFTPLSTHGGNIPPVVLGTDSELGLSVDAGHGSARLEVDGGDEGSPPERLTVRLRSEMATLVSFSDAEPLLGELRRRQILMDSPRLLARAERDSGD